MAQVDAAARAALDPDRFIRVVVGDAAKVRPQLDSLRLPVEVVPAAPRGRCPRIGREVILAGEIKMANVDGSWDTVAHTPMGDQQATLNVTSAGDSFTGTYSGALGSTQIQNGKVDGDKLMWSLDITVPMPMTLTCEATVNGDTLKGTVTAGSFGAFPLEGKRA